MNSKKFLRQEQAMSVAINEARDWARAMIQRESRGAGDLENAMRRLATRHEGVTRSLLWSLLYRPPKDMLVSKYLSLREAYLTECERQERALRHEREITKAKSRISSALVSASDALVGKEAEQ